VSYYLIAAREDEEGRERASKQKKGAKSCFKFYSTLLIAIL
jgi:hypothetical protein